MFGARFLKCVIKFAFDLLACQPNLGSFYGLTHLLQFFFLFRVNLTAVVLEIGLVKPQNSASFFLGLRTTFCPLRLIDLSMIGIPR